MSSCYEQLGLLSVAQAQAKMKRQLAAPTNIERIALDACLGRVLAADLVSPLNVPPFDNSAMDGYALKAEDLAKNDNLQLVGSSFAGKAYSRPLQQGQCIRIMTGAAVPKGADCVIMQEQTQVTGQTITFLTKAKRRQNIRDAGEDMKTGAVILKAGLRITVREMQLIASLGLAELTVHKKLKVAVFSTGNELKAAGAPLEAGQIYDSNRIGIISLLKRLDLDVLDLGIIPDDKQCLLAAFNKADESADVLITSGGVSVGEADYTKELLEELGQIGFWKLAIKPGKPFAFGQLPNSVFFGLPGNPVSALVTLYQLAVPAIAQLMGWDRPTTQRLLVKAEHKIKKSPGRIEYQRGIYQSANNGELSVSSTGHQGSGVFSSLSQANCFIVLEHERATVNPGDLVWVEPFDNLLG